MLRDHASFQATYPGEGNPGRAAAEPVTLAVLDGLAAAGYAIDRLDGAPGDQWSAEPVA